MTYKLMALDLDDTLLREDLTISRKTRAALLRAQKRGMKLVLISGRPTEAIWTYARQLKLDEHGGFIVSFNGAVAVDCTTGETLFEQTLSCEHIHELFDLSVGNNLYIHSYLDERIVTPKMNPYTAIERQLTGMPVHEVPDFKAAMNRAAVKVILLEDPAVLKEHASRLALVLGDRMNVCITKPYFLECMAKGIDKQRCLALLLDRLGIHPSQVIAVGDSYNDIGMIRFAGLGVCVANGRPEVQAVADYVTKSNMEDGVAAVVEKMVLKAGARGR